MASATRTVTTPAVNDVKLIRWRGGVHPSQYTIMQLLQQEGLQPYVSALRPNSRDGARSHGYAKIVYCLEGTLEVVLPDLDHRVTLRGGDRLELPRGTRYATVVGLSGARVVESVVRTGGTGRLPSLP